MTVECIRPGEKPRRQLGLFSAVFLLLACFLVVMTIVFYIIAKHPPQWWVDRQEVSRQIQQQDDPVASAFLNRYAIEGVYIPPEVQINNGGEGVVLVGPKDTINRIYRKAYGLDEKKWPFEWNKE